MPPKQFATTGFLSLVLATLILVVSLFAFKLDIDEHFAKESQAAIQQHPDHEIASKETTVLGVGAEGWTAIFTGVLAAFTMGLAGVTYRLFRVTKKGIDGQAALTRDALCHADESARASRDAVDVAREAVIADHRAWLKVRAEVGNQPLRFGGPNGAEFAVAIFAENIGNAPAISVSPHADMYAWRSEPSKDPVTRHSIACQAIKLQRPRYDYTLWPGERFPEILDFGAWNLGLALSQDDIDAALKASAPHVVIWIGGCVDYTFPADPHGHHQSRFLLELRRADHAPIDPSAGNIGPELLRFSRPFFGQGNSAD